MGNRLQKPKSIGHQEESESEFTCEICAEPMFSAMKFRNSSLCTHPFCLDCIAKYIEAKVEEGMTTAGRIICPGLNCENPLDPLACRPIISKQLFSRWCDLLQDSAIVGVEKSYCPHPNCSALVLNECGDNLKKIKCPNCKKDFCFGCKVPWHAGYWCRESAQFRDRNDTLVGQLIEREKWTRCYNCGHAVQRIDGCKGVRCRCGVTFCHGCGKQIHLLACGSTRNWDCCNDQVITCAIYTAVATAWFIVLMIVLF